MRIKYLFASIFLESFAAYNLYVNDGVFSVYLYILIHIIVSFLLALVLFPVFFLKFRREKLGILITLSTLFFITFIFGIIFLIIYIIYAKIKGKNIEDASLDIIEFEEISENIQGINRKLGEGALKAYDPSAPQALKINILSLIKNYKYQSAGKILKEALSDSDDEIRLLAFSILSKEEDKINKDIVRLKEKLKNLDSKEEKAEVLKKLGMLYWETIFLDITDEELKKYYLETAKKYLLESLEIKEDFEVNFLLGRILLREGKVSEAKSLFMKLYEVGYKTKVIPYLMEIFYYEKNFAKVVNLAKEIDIYSMHPNFYHNYKVWLDEKI